MSQSIQSLIESGTKLWLDSIDPDLVEKSRKMGATGATSNPIIIANILSSGAFDREINELGRRNSDHETIAWMLTDKLVSRAEKVFQPVFEQTGGEDGYVSFELDPLIEDSCLSLSVEERAARYVKEGMRWGKKDSNRLIKVPATPAGLASLKELVANGINVNVTLIFTMRQYHLARQSVWEGAQRRKDLAGFKSVYSIFVSRVDVYTQKHSQQLPSSAQGLVGIVNAKRIWRDNKDFWADKDVTLSQEIVFASTGVKNIKEQPWKYVEAFAGSDIETNPPETNDQVASSGRRFSPQIKELPGELVIQTIDQHIDWQHLEKTLMSEGIEKFIAPQQALLQLISGKLLG